MNIAIQNGNDAIHMIFYKAMFYFDDFQPGLSMFHTGKFNIKNIGESDRATVEALNQFMQSMKCGVKSAAFKLNEAGDVAIEMMHVSDSDGDESVVIEFPMMTGKPKLCIGAQQNGIAVTGDEATFKLRCGSVGEEKPEEKEALEFFLKALDKIVSECTGNAT